MSTSSQSPLTGQQLVEIRFRAEAATPGPWKAMAIDADVSTVWAGGNTVRTAIRVGRIVTCADAEFIASARTDVTALLDQVEQLQRTYTFDTAELKRRLDQALNAAIEAARGEYLHDDTGTPDDVAYNRGVTDAIAAIGKLLEGGAR